MNTKRSRPVRAGFPPDAGTAIQESSVAAEYLESALLSRAGFRHAFFTRAGGVSTGPYESLSFSVAVGDSPENVVRNLERAATVLGVPAGRIYFLSQVHGTATLTVDGREPRERVLEREGDAVLSSVSDLACGVRSADCVPVLVGDRRSGAAVAIHAGWRGVVRGAVESGVSELCRLSGDDAELIAAIGPHIREQAFEVSPDVAAELAAVSPVPAVTWPPGGGKPHVSLVRIVTAKLLALGVADRNIDDVGGCTALEPERFFSFRRDGKTGGRHLSAIVPAAPRTERSGPRKPE
jgi:polyphenol oxidase